MADSSSSTSSFPGGAPDGDAPRSLEYGRPGKRPALPQRVVDVLKTLSLVVPLTILIWIYAEREQSINAAGVSFPIEVRISDPSRIATLREPADHNVIVTLAGPRTAVERVTRDLQSGTADHPTFQITLDSAQFKSRGVFDRPMLDVLTKNPIFIRNGISVKDAVPGTLRVEIDDLETRDVEVRAPENLANIKDTQFVPADVKVTAPKGTWERATKPYVIADLSKLESLKEPGKHDEKYVPLIWPNQPDHVTLESRNVTAHFDVQQKEERDTIGSVPVWVEGPPQFFNDYAVALKLPGGAASLTDVPLAGPPEKIAKIRRGELSALAVLHVNFTNVAPDESRTEPAQFDLPADVHFVGDPQKYQITYVISVRK
jgi:hypothetical protein